MKIEIELGFSHIRDSIVLIDQKLASMDPDAPQRVSLQHMRDALMQGLPIGMQRMVAAS